ncbi:MAG: FAD-dependent oxidoreductase, partial [Aliidongia sp.]
MSEVAILGGGPAGAAAAIACRRAGLDTLLIEQREECPLDREEAEETIGPECVRLLRRLGIDCAGSATPFSGIALNPDRWRFGGGVPVAGFHLRRSWLDRVLRQTAVGAGAVLRMGVRLNNVERAGASGFRLDSDCGTITARWVIDASGRRHWLARRFRLYRRRLSPPLIAWRDILHDHGRSDAFARFQPEAEGWVFLAEITRQRIVRTRLRTAGSGSPASDRPATAHNASWCLIRPLAGAGWFLVGEAAGALDPAAGSG